MANADRCVCCGEIVVEGRMVCPKCENESVKDKPNCEKCLYRHLLADEFGVPVDANDCDQYGRDLCKKMNDPGFLKWLETRVEYER